MEKMEQVINNIDGMSGRLISAIVQLTSDLKQLIIENRELRAEIGNLPKPQRATETTETTE